MTFALAQFAPETAGQAAVQRQAAGLGTNGRAPQGNTAQRAGPG
ncbi:MAG: hypothetical protein JWN24_4096 [Phycisphaerales bacterium]|jgi:hypothetical protein|nr:hypothetical protein [Phycisphaerales bacterium]